MDPLAHFAYLIPKPVMLAASLAVVLLLTSVLVLNKRQRQAVIERFHFHQRRTSGANTPPRSLSPEKVPGVSEKELSPATSAKPEYSSVFPPSRRSVLPDFAGRIPNAESSLFSAEEPSLDRLKANSLVAFQSYPAQAGKGKFTPTGFSTDEIEALGDFPDYDALSGVPLPSVYQGFNPQKAVPRPYRPFRWAYHQTMSLTKLEPDWWLEVENTYKERVLERRGLYEKYGKMVLDHLPGSELACKELMEMCLQFYCARYPSQFSLSADKSVFHNSLLGEDTYIKRIICSSLGWNLGTKIGLQLEEIHRPIPDYKAKMSFSMDRYFSKMPTNAPIQRGSWGLEVGKPLFMPPGHPHEKFRDYQKDDLTVDDCHLRVDWQTLRRLPLSAGIVFNFKALFTPVPEFRDEPYVPSLLLKILKEGKKSLMEYKNTWHVEHVCIPALEAYQAEQRAKNIVKGAKEGEDWEVSTLDESPYFPGWEVKWHRLQGF